jgi:hypothetical protein
MLVTNTRSSSLGRDDPDPVLCERRPELPLEAAGQALALAEHPLADRVDLLTRAHPVGASRVDPGFELVVKVGHPHHEELVQVRLPDGAELGPL